MDQTTRQQGALDSHRMPLNPTYAYIGAFVDELQRAGVHNIVICPGSRSTPLALACAEQPALRVWIHVDERSAAYFGLGMAKQLRQPVALLCSSGTAAANFLPAIIEARLSRVPLLVLTADRPHELRENGAPQSIDQNRLYGTHVKWFVEVALPEASNAALRYIRALASRSVALTRAIPAGPVHLNFPFREPLTPEPIADQPLPDIARRDPLSWKGRENNAPYVQVQHTAPDTPTNESIDRLLELTGNAPHGLIIVGPLDNPPLAEPLLEVAERLGYPVLADPLSQLRCGQHDQRMVISSYDAFLRIDSFVERAQPELILRFGAMPTSKPVLLYLKRHASCPLVVVDGQGGWEEPTQLASEYIYADPAALCQQLLNQLEQQHANTKGRAEWLAMWQNSDKITRQTMQAVIQDFAEPFEGRVFTELAELLPDGTTLYVGNSMPVRDLDTFFWSSQQRIRVLGNRGANGIDGLISSALGASAGVWCKARATEEVRAMSEEARATASVAPTIPEERHARTVLIVGDLSFFHDLNGLLAARLHKLDLTIVLVNNDGGGIFSFLPQAAYPDHFEQLFGTPTGLDFRLAVEMYGGLYVKAENWAQFREQVSAGLAHGGLRVIEVTTERASNVTLHRKLWKSVREALERQES